MSRCSRQIHHGKNGQAGKQRGRAALLLLSALASLLVSLLASVPLRRVFHIAVVDVDCRRDCRRLSILAMLGWRTAGAALAKIRAEAAGGWIKFPPCVHLWAGETLEGR